MLARASGATTTMPVGRAGGVMSNSVGRIAGAYSTIDALAEDVGGKSSACPQACGRPTMPGACAVSLVAA